MKILLVNEGLSDNFGDRAIRYTLEKMLEELGHDVFFQDYTRIRNVPEWIPGSSSPQDKISGIKKILPRGLKFFIKNIFWRRQLKFRISKIMKTSACDLLILGGGQCLRANKYFPYAFRQWLAGAHHYNVDVCLFGIGIDSTIAGRTVRKMKDEILSIDDIYFRDYYSVEFLHKTLNKDSLFIPDVVFGINRYYTDLPEKKEIVLLGVVGFDTIIRSNSGILKEDYYQWWEERYLEFQDAYEIRLLYNTKEDYQESILFQSFISEKYGRNIALCGHRNLSEWINEIARAKIIISGRMHALILGWIFKVGISSFPFLPKVNQFMKEYIQDSGKAPSRLSDELFETLAALLDKKNRRLNGEYD